MNSESRADQPVGSAFATKLTLVASAHARLENANYDAQSTKV